MSEIAVLIGGPLEDGQPRRITPGMDELRTAFRYRAADGADTYGVEIYRFAWRNPRTGHALFFYAGRRIDENRPPPPLRRFDDHLFD